MYNAIKIAVVEIVSVISTVLTSIGDGLKDFKDTVIDPVINFLSDVIKEIANIGDYIYLKISSFIKWIYDNIISKVTEDIYEFFKNVLSFFKDIFGEFYE
jgi:hypothetical protein